MTTREQIISAAKECGAKTRIYEKSPGIDHYLMDTNQIVNFYKYTFEAGRQAEREDIANLILSTDVSLAPEPWKTWVPNLLVSVVNIIRARSTK